MDFGFTLKPDHSLERIASLTRLAESAGFTYGWLFDSHVLWKEPYVLLTLMAQNTKRMRLGTCVTNPATREPTELAMLEEASNVIRDLCEGREVTYEGTKLRFDWTGKQRLPVWIAGYGPKALELTGRIADGAIIQLADPSLVGWCIGLLRDGARKAGRDTSAVSVMVAAPAHLGPRDKVRDRVRWFPALVSNHVVDLVKRYGEKGLPADLTAYVRNRPGYDYQHHAESGSSNAAFVDDESVDRFCVTGEIEEHIEKLRQLAGIGVRQFNIYLMSGEEERILELYGEKIIPSLAGVTASV